MDLSQLTTISFGFLLGLRHALDADHVAAVASIGEPGGGLRRALTSGFSWGVGHAATLGLAGGAAILLRASIPPWLAQGFEFAAGGMLIVLGLLALRGALRDRLHVHAHRHDDREHVHLHFHSARHSEDAEIPHVHSHPFRIALRPFLVGGVHGLAGSAALALLVLTTIPTVLAGCLYIVVFGVGTMAGMMLMSLVLGAPLLIARRRAVLASRCLRATAGIASLGVGFALAWRTGAALFG